MKVDREEEVLVIKCLQNFIYPGDNVVEQFIWKPEEHPGITLEKEKIAILFNPLITRKDTENSNKIRKYHVGFLVDVKSILPPQMTPKQRFTIVKGIAKEIIVTEGPLAAYHLKKIKVQVFKKNPIQQSALESLKDIQPPKGEWLESLHVTDEAELFSRIVSLASKKKSNTNKYMSGDLKLDKGTFDGFPFDDAGTHGNLKKQLKEKKLPKEVRERCVDELAKLNRMGPIDPEKSVHEKYIETILKLPWLDSSKEIHDIDFAEKTLEEGHSGLHKVKERILEFVAVRILKKNTAGSIICLQGPPGVGKTSMGKSIAAALGKSFAKISLAGLSDENEIKGHRRTYIGAMHGSILDALMRAKTNNPVILLDEIDKIVKNRYGRGGGDPTSAMLEVLDPNFNNTFTDHFLQIPFDLSNVLFVATSNYVENIPTPLLDRMEVISIPGYTVEEKVDISTRFLIPKQINQCGVDPKFVKLDSKTARYVILAYTKEAGVRNLERCFEQIMRKIALRYIKKNKEKFALANSDKEAGKIQFTPEQIINVSKTEIKDALGNERYLHKVVKEIDQPGLVYGLSWTEYGGSVMLVEFSRCYGKGKIKMTGQLGKVLQESVVVSMGFLATHKEMMMYLVNLSNERTGNQNSTKEMMEQLSFDNYDLYLHFPSGAIPKDGPSAGVTITIGLMSLLFGQKVKENFCMTGEISLKGAVLPVGGVKEKCLAAYAEKLTDVIIPKQNKLDLEELSPEVRNSLNFHAVDNVLQAASLVFGWNLNQEESENLLKLSLLDVNKMSKL